MAVLIVEESPSYGNPKLLDWLRQDQKPRSPPVVLTRDEVKVVLAKRAACHTFRHSFATQLLESGYGIRTVDELLGHKKVKTTIIHTHVLNHSGKGVKSLVDAL